MGEHLQRKVVTVKVSIAAGTFFHSRGLHGSHPSDPHGKQWCHRVTSGYLHPSATVQMCCEFICVFKGGFVAVSYWFNGIVSFQAFCFLRVATLSPYVPIKMATKMGKENDWRRNNPCERSAARRAEITLV